MINLLEILEVVFLLVATVAASGILWIFYKEFGGPR